jgi:hypothetical protein
MSKEATDVKTPKGGYLVYAANDLPGDNLYAAIEHIKTFATLIDATAFVDRFLNPYTQKLVEDGTYERPAMFNPRILGNVKNTALYEVIDDGNFISEKQYKLQWKKRKELLEELGLKDKEATHLCISEL